MSRLSFARKELLHKRMRNRVMMMMMTMMMMMMTPIVHAGWGLRMKKKEEEEFARLAIARDCMRQEERKRVRARGREAG